jgi:hypothetical protein
MTTDERIPALLAGLRSLVGSSTEHPTAEEARRLADKLQDVAAKLKAQAGRPQTKLADTPASMGPSFTLDTSVSNTQLLQPLLAH